MTTEEIKIWKKNIINAINDLSNLELQKETWSGTHSEFCTSFSETIALLYDTFDFVEFIDYYKSKKGEDNLYKMFAHLNNLIELYTNIGFEKEQKQNGYLEILNDNDWIVITNYAEKVIEEISLIKQKDKGFL